MPGHESPSQTAGPYVHIGCAPNFVGIDMYGGTDLGAAMKTGPVSGPEVRIEGTVFDGDGEPVRDAVVEVWQADAHGRFAGQDGADPNFTGWGRCPCDFDTGQFHFDTVKPGPVPTSDGQMQAPHVSVWIVARGINVGLQTRLYFPDEADANANDPLLRLVDTDRRPTLIAKPEGNALYRFDIRLQGAAETVFLDI